MKNKLLEDLSVARDVDFYKSFNREFFKKVVKPADELKLFERLGLLSDLDDIEEKVDIINQHVDNFMVITLTGPVIAN
jgi:hypothetical protein